MSDSAHIRGELQAQIMSALWRIEAGTVEQVRAALPPRYRGAYTTVQTVLNRLAERGLLARERQGQAMVYRARLSEAQYLERSIEQTLASASADARSAALVALIGKLDADGLADLQDLAKQASTVRRGARKR